MVPSSDASLYHGLYQMMVVRGGLGVQVGGCLGAVCLANDMSGVVELGLVASFFLFFLYMCNDALEFRLC